MVHVVLNTFTIAKLAKYKQFQLAYIIYFTHDFSSPWKIENAHRYFEFGKVSSSDKGIVVKFPQFSWQVLNRNRRTSNSSSSLSVKVVTESHHIFFPQFICYTLKVDQ